LFALYGSIRSGRGALRLDVRPVLVANGIADLFDAWVLSFERGIQKTRS
jgi:hypothetical protein